MNTAMIFAAGRGERLRPLTDTCPKALCLVHGKPLIEHHIVNLANAGITTIIINHAHLGGQIRRRLGNGARFGVTIHYCPEPPGALETGGGLFNARHFLEDKPFFTVNADIVTDYDFNLLRKAKPSLIHLVLVKKPPYYSKGDFGLSLTNQVTNTERNYTFSGIACYQPMIFERLKPGRYSLAPLLRSLAADQLVTGEIHNNQWLDIGTLERLHQANYSGANSAEA